LVTFLDDYCPRERRVTNHAVVAMVATTSNNALHHVRIRARVQTSQDPSSPTQDANARRAGGPGPRGSSQAARARFTRRPTGDEADSSSASNELAADAEITVAVQVEDDASVEAAFKPSEDDLAGEGETGEDRSREEGPVHRPLIRASLPRTEGQPPPSRPATDFTIRQPTGRQNRFRPRHQQGGGQFQGNRGNGNFGGAGRDGGSRQGGRPPQGGMAARNQRRNDSGRKRSR